MPQSVADLFADWQGLFGRHRNIDLWRAVPHCCFMVSLARKELCCMDTPKLAKYPCQTSVLVRHAQKMYPLRTREKIFFYSVYGPNTVMTCQVHLGHGRGEKRGRYSASLALFFEFSLLQSHSAVDHCISATSKAIPPLPKFYW